MKKNYNYNYENRALTKSSVHFSNVELASCKASVLKKSPVSDGMLWHTTDTNEFYFDWDGKRTKMNVSGDSASIAAEIAKIKADMAKLNPDAVQQKVNQLERKVNNAVSTVNNLQQSVNGAVADAQAASEAAENAAAQVANKADKSYVDDAIAAIGTPDLSDYAKKSDIPDVSNFVEESDLADYAKKSELPDLDDYAKKSELPDVTDFVKEEDLADYAKKTDMPVIPENVSAFINDAGYLTSVDLPDFFKDSDFDDFVKVEDLENFIPKSELDNLASKSDLAGYVKAEDALYYLTSDDLADYAKKSEMPDIPENVSSFINDAGYLTEDDLPDFLKESDLDAFAVGSFPAAADADDEEAPADGYAKVQDVMDYVNALFEKKKDELAPVSGVPYAYITGYALDGTPTDITVFNPFELNEEGDTEIEIYTGEEITTYSPSTYEDLPSVKLTVDIPNGYYIKDAYIWNDDIGANGDYELMDGARTFDVNPRYSSRVINGVTYNSYSRGPVNDTAASPANEKYKIIITKQ